MLKSTYKPSAAFLAATAPLPPGWTEHKAPSGRSYYYHAETKQSKYERPGQPAAASTTEPPQAPPAAPYALVPNLSDPRVANAFVAQYDPRPRILPRQAPGIDQRRPRPQPVDKPRRKEAIPGCEPWILVYTKYLRRFVYNPVKNASYWRIPEKLMPGILELDKARIRDKASESTSGDKASSQPRDEPAKEEATANEQAGDSSEYEEVEVTEDEDEARGDNLDGEHRFKRRRTGDSADGEERQQDGPLEFTEADIAAQLQLLGDDYDLEPGDYEDGNMDHWPEGTAGLSQEDAKSLFKDLLSDFKVNPYSPWDKLLDEGKLVDDARYTALSTTRARRECWDEWCREKIAELKEQRAKQEKDPKVAYMAFLQEKATPKLYWQEFRRKYKKEEPMKDMRLPDKDREKAYREHINRLKLPMATLKSDLTALLRAQPLHLLHGKTLSSGLPTAVLTDARYISLEAKTRDALIEAYVQTLPPPPQDTEAAEGDENRKESDARARRERALEERNRVVEEQKRRREKEVAASRARLRQGEREIEMARQVDKRGLQGQLVRELPGEREGEPREA